MLYSIQCLVRLALALSLLAGAIALPAQCGQSNWTNSIANDCGDLQPSGGLAANSPTIFCEGQTVTVENNSTPVSQIQTTYVDWGDGSCQTFNGFQAIMTHAYDFPNDTCILSNSNGTIVFPVRLGVERSCPTNLKSFNFVLFNVVVRFKPIADFIASPAVLCVDVPVNFSNTSCENSNNPMYLWNFGDGTTSTLENPPPHTYSTAGTYTVSLQVTNSCGSDTHTQTVLVTPPATAVATPSASTICAGQTVTLTNQSANAVGSSWTITPNTGIMFVSGTTASSPNPVIQFNTPGTYTVRLRSLGCGNPEWTTVIEVLAPASIALAPIPDGCATGNVTINPTATVSGSSPTVGWQFPGGSPGSSNNNPPGPVTYTMQGTYIVTASATNACGTAMDSDTFSIAPAATAVFVPSSTSLCGPDEILILSNNSVNGSSFTWSISPNTGFIFVNNTSATSASPQLQFSQEGTYTITLRVNACGNPESTQTVTVRLKPTVAIVATPDQCSQSVTLNPASLVTFGGGAADATDWTFLNGSIPGHSGPTPPAVSFSGVGSYAISVSVNNGCGMQSVSDTFQILALATAQAALSDDTLCAPAETLLLSNTSTNAFSTNPYTWTLTPSTGFTFVNGTSASSPNPEIEFTKEGLYQIKLTVNGCSMPEWTGSVLVILSPGVTLSTVPEGCADVTHDPLSFTQFSNGTPASIAWSFGGGNPATASGPTPGPVAFSGFGQHFIAVTVANACGTVTAVDSFQIFEPAQVAIDSVGPLCNTDAPLQLQVTPAGGEWSGPGVSATGIFTPANATLNGPSQLLYVFDIGDPSCKVQDMISILVQGTAVNVGPDLLLCGNAGVLQLPATPLNGAWTGTGVSASGVFDPVLAGPGAQLLVYTFVDTLTGCVNADSLTLTVLGVPAAALDSIGRICVNEPLDLGPFSGGTDVSNCQWDFGDGTSANICDPVHVYTQPGNYTLTLYVENAAGCKDTAMTDIQVVTPPNAVFATDTTEGCADLPVLITNLSAINNYTEYIWNYGNGQSDTLPQPGTIVFTQAETDTTYLITLSAVNGCGSASAQIPVTVFPRPQVRFGTDVSSGCTPLEVNFNNVTVGEPDFFEWYVNGQLVSTAFQLPQQVFLTTDHDSTYFIALVAANECGIDTVVHSVLVKPNPVTAFFNTDTLIGCQPFAVQLIDYSTQGLYISWDLGDGTTATGDTVAHTYTAAGQYLVQEFVNNGCGFDTAVVSITVLPAPAVSFTHLPYVCLNDTIYFQNTSPAIIGSYWSFGDGTTDSTQSSSFHVYDSVGVYTVQMTGLAVTTGCPATTSSSVEVKPLPQALVTLPDSAGCQPFVLQALNATPGSGNTFVWNFGDGSTTVGPSGQHTYTAAGSYTLSLQATDFFKCKNTWTYAPIQVHPKPVAAFSVSQTELCVTPTTLLFDNQSIDADAYQWSFGTLGTSQQIHPSLTVNTPGALPVTLLAINQFGCRDTLQRSIAVYTRPELEFMADAQLGCEPFYVQFSNQSLGVNQFAWHFGDGQVSDQPEPAHLYQSAGLYAVTLYASADSVCFDSLRFNDYIRVQPSPMADFSYVAVTDTTVVPNGIFRFTDLSVNAIRWHWDFGDGDTSDLANPEHRYYTNGPHPVTLIVYNTLDCPDTLIKILVPDFFGNLFIPNALAPEAGQATEREFKAVGLGLREFDIAVYASNGQRVWHSNALVEGQPSEAWNGRLNNEGDLLPQGVYWWKVRARFENGQIWQGMAYGNDAPVTEGKVLLIR
ncbi:MAG: PKD domain-containing protein [Saprospiraceae bacterium]|nr:PKD domain-containing protein [Saprospiraceae bacterium]